MNIKRYFPSAWVLAGVIIFAFDACRSEVGVSTVTVPSTTTTTTTTAPAAPLTEMTTAAAPVDVEPFINPFGTKKPKIVSGFGKREVRTSSLTPGTTGPMLTEMHEGVDYKAFPGSAVKAARSGRVIFAGFSKMYVSRSDKTDQHRLVIIRHPDGMSTRYVHLNTLHVKPGQDVKSGQVIGVLAESDEWSEPVLHFEIRDIRGQPLNPIKVLAEPPSGAAQ